MEKDTIERLRSLFSGLERAYGMYDMSNPERLPSGKLKGRAITRELPVTDDLWARHLEGGQGLGVVPIREDNTCFFAAIDVDGDSHKYVNFDAKDFAMKAYASGLPLIACRSKSGGVHLYVFFNEPAPAVDVRAKLKEMAALLDLPKDVELFPKQVEIKVERKDFGSWINMPYFNEVITERYAIGPAGETLTLNQFLDLAESRRQDKTLLSTKFEIKDEGRTAFPDGPPCLQRMHKHGVPEGHRDNVLIQIVTYERLAHPDSWQQNAIDHAIGPMFPDPLPQDQVLNATRAKSKRYNYRCQMEPFTSFCDTAVCRMRKYGVGKNGEHGEIGPNPIGGGDDEAPVNFPNVGQLRKLNTDPPLYFLDVNDRAVTLTAEELESPRLFRRKVMQTIDYAPPIPTDASWTRMLNDMFATITYIEVTDDSSAAGVVWGFLERFCQKFVGRSRDDVINGKAWSEDGQTFFQLEFFMTFLRVNHFKDMDRREVAALLHKRGADNVGLKIRGKNTKVWRVSEFSKLEPKKVDESEMLA